MAFEQQRANAWLYGVLSGDATLNTTLGVGGRIYKVDIPQNPVFPYIRYQNLAATDIMCIGPTMPRPWVHLTYVVSAVVKLPWAVSPLPLEAIMNQVDDLLHGKYNVVVGSYLVTCWREDVIEPPPESIDNVQYQQLMATYTVMIQNP
jgi:hypothetical protein